MKLFDNKNRTRYYGLRIGDIVSSKFELFDNAEVIEYGGFDNNRVFIKSEDETIRSVVAEWCTIINKVEDL